MIPRDILAILAQQRAELAQLAPRNASALLTITLDVQRELAARMRDLAGDRFSTQQVRIALLQVQQLVEDLGAQLGVEVGDRLETLGRASAKIGRATLIEEVRTWGKVFPHSVRPITNARLSDDVLSDGLLEYYQVSRDTYGMDAIAKMRRVLSVSAQTGDTFDVATVKITEAIDLPLWKSERIVRTESSFAMHQRQLADMLDVYGDDGDGWRKQLVATLDGRTGEDSIFVNRQVRRLTEPFEDNHGRIYMMPPNRPNDREVVVIVPVEAVEGLDPEEREGEAGKREARASEAEREAHDDPPPLPTKDPALTRTPGDEKLLDDLFEKGARFAQGSDEDGAELRRRLETLFEFKSPRRGRIRMSVGNSDALGAWGSCSRDGKVDLAQAVADGFAKRDMRSVWTAVHEQAHSMVRKIPETRLGELIEEASVEETAQAILRARFPGQWRERYSFGNYQEYRSTLRGAVRSAAEKVGVELSDEGAAEWIAQRRLDVMRSKTGAQIERAFLKGAKFGDVAASKELGSEFKKIERLLE